MGDLENELLWQILIFNLQKAALVLRKTAKKQKALFGQILAVLARLSAKYSFWDDSIKR